MPSPSSARWSSSRASSATSNQARGARGRAPAAVPAPHRSPGPDVLYCLHLALRGVLPPSPVPAPGHPQHGAGQRAGDSRGVRRRPRGRRHPPVRTPAAPVLVAFYVDFVRSTPLLVQLVWVFFALPIL